VQLLCFSVHGSAVVAANIIMTHPLIMNAATQICFFTARILHNSAQIVEEKVRDAAGAFPRRLRI
jgi:hypothetical protein